MSHTLNHKPNLSFNLFNCVKSPIKWFENCPVRATSKFKSLINQDLSGFFVVR